MNVRDFMQTEVVTLKVTDDLGLADDLMRLARVRHMPVVSSTNEVVGIISQRDLFRAAISSVLHLRKTAEREWLSKIPVREVMTTRVYTVDPAATLCEAVETMLNKRIGCLPVVGGGTLVGLLSESDWLRYLTRRLAIRRVNGQLKLRTAC